MFQFLGCKRTSTKVVKCDFVVNNESGKRKLEFYANENSRITRIVETSGNELAASQVVFGRNSGNQTSNVLSSGVPIKGSFIFCGNITDNLVLFDVAAYSYSNRAYKTGALVAFSVKIHMAGSTKLLHI